MAADLDPDDLQGIIDARDARIAELVAEVEGLHAAMEHGSLIEQAKGVLMNTLQCGPDAAFAVLVAQSQAENRKLRDIAEEIATRHGKAGDD